MPEQWCGEKELIGNRAYRLYLRRTGAGKAFEIDAGKLADEARFDGIFVLRSAATSSAPSWRWCSRRNWPTAAAPPK